MYNQGQIKDFLRRFFFKRQTKNVVGHFLEEMTKNLPFLSRSLFKYTILWRATIIEPLYEKKFKLHVQPGADQGFFEAIILKKRQTKNVVGHFLEEITKNLPFFVSLAFQIYYNLARHNNRAFIRKEV